ncbi:MAG: integrase arm-type DNA-binding domain-containing protein [Pseudomonadota bacterium]
MALTDTFIKQAKPNKPVGDKHSDGGGMYLLVKEAGKYWRMDYRFLGKRKTLALGVYPAVTLASARKRRDQARVLLAEGIDPAAAKRSQKISDTAAAQQTFEAVAHQWLANIGPSRSASTQEKVTGWLQQNIFPWIGKNPIAQVTARDVLAAVRKIEARGAIDSAHRIKQVCGQIFRFAVAEGLVERDVTADLRGALAPVVKSHHPAITEPKQVGALLRSIFDYNGHPAALAALKLAPLLFVRPGELRAAEWLEIDLDAAEWRIPGAKMKMKVEHLVPLSTQAVAILRELQPITGHGKYVFPSLRSKACMSENTINAALRGMGYPKEIMTGHGFRAMARTILDEVLGERVDLIEHQLAHTVRDALGRAYNRTSHLPARREMMQRWADYLDKLRCGVSVIPLHSTA